MHCLNSKLCSKLCFLSSMSYTAKVSCTWQKQPLEVFFKKGVPKNFANFTGKHLCWRFFLIKLKVWRPATLLRKTAAQVFSCDICEIFKNTYFEEHLRAAATAKIVFSKNCRNCFALCHFMRSSLLQQTQSLFNISMLCACIWNSTDPFNLPISSHVTKVSEDRVWKL